MKEQKDWIEQRQRLRDLADSALASLLPDGSAAQPIELMLHELLVHKVELEMQIEELQQAHLAAEADRDHYDEYYEFAPVGYLSIETDGAITEANLTVAELLDIDRAALLEYHFVSFVTPPDRQRWKRLLQDMTAQAEPEPRAVALRIARADGSVFEAYLGCRRPPFGSDAKGLRITLLDIGKLPQI